MKTNKEIFRKLLQKMTLAQLAVIRRDFIFQKEIEN